MVEIILFMFFVYFLLFPITETLREVETGKLEIFLAAPIKSSDVLLGEFLGDVPLYSIAIVVIAGFFTAALNPLGLGFFQIVIIVLIFVFTLLSALWIGTVIAAFLRTRLGQFARGKDIGRALSVMIALPLVALIYSIMGGGLFNALLDPGTSGIVRMVLGFLPSSWGGELIVTYATNPGTIVASGLKTITHFGGILVFFCSTLWIGGKVADRTYSLESSSFTASITKPDGVFYNSIRSVGRESFGILLSSIFKDYSRRLENISWLIYVVGLIALVNIFFGGPSGGAGDTLESISLLTIPMLTGFVVGTVSRGKEKISLYRKTPSGISRFVKARLFHGWMLAIPIAAVVTTVSTIFVQQSTIINILGNVLASSFRTLVNVMFVFGLALLIPTFSEESRARSIGIVINLQVVLFSTIGLEIGLNILGLRFNKIFPSIDLYSGILFDQLLQSIVFLLLGIVLVNLGKRKLYGIE
jgi:hypothetical protein